MFSANLHVKLPTDFVIVWNFGKLSVRTYPNKENSCKYNDVITRAWWCELAEATAGKAKGST